MLFQSGKVDISEAPPFAGSIVMLKPGSKQLLQNSRSK